MARKIILKENGLLNSQNTPTGYRYVGYDGVLVSEKFGSTISAIGGGGDNFANSDLTFTEDRIHELGGYKFTLNDGVMRIIASGSTSGDIPFEVFKSDGTTSILKARGNGNIFFGSDVIEQYGSTYNTQHTIITPGQVFFVFQGPFGSHNITCDTFGNFSISAYGNGSSGSLNLYSTSGVLNIQTRATTEANLITNLGLNYFPSNVMNMVYIDGGSQSADLLFGFKKTNGEIFTATVPMIFATMSN